ncbi:MAG: hypothetical protein ACE5LV_04140 [Candidatus Aminicenantales bacterium]
MTFAIITAASVLFLAAGLSYRRFALTLRGSKKMPLVLRLGEYFSWVVFRTVRMLQSIGHGRVGALYREWFVLRYPPRLQWLFILLAVSYGYCAGSGFLFAFIGTSGLHGVFLLVHVGLGGIFAGCMCAAVVLRARFYVWNVEAFSGPSAGVHLKTEQGLRVLLSVASFWALVASALVLVLAALGMMLPVFSLKGQLVVFAVHRYAALVSVLSGIVWMDASRISRP